MKPKYIRVSSDLHLEQFYGQREELLAAKLIPEDERDSDAILALAGDISSKPDQLLAFLSAIESRFQKVIFIPGNHSYYRHEYFAWNQLMNERFQALKNTLWANGVVGHEELDDVRFIYTTLWADGGKSVYERGEVSRGLCDFRLIRIGACAFKIADMVELHRQQKAQLIELLKVPFDGKTVVITHHMPSYRLCHPRFGTDLNGGFASDCDDILSSEYAPQLWVFAHTHDRVSTKLWNTRLECNPTGYVSERNSPFRGGDKVFVGLESLEVV